MNAMYIIWIVAISLFIVLESMTSQLISIWFMFGSICALIAALCDVSIPLQLVIFIAITVIALFATRPLVKKYVTTKIQKTNADRCIGEDAVVLEEINNLVPTGQVKVDGQVWTARAADGEIIAKDEIVKIEKIDGVKLIVSSK